MLLNSLRGGFGGFLGFVLVFGVVWGVCWWGFVGLVGVLGLVWTRVVVVGLGIAWVLGRNGVGSGVLEHHWAMGSGDGLVIAEFPSFEEDYRVCNRFWPLLTVEIRELLSWEKTKEITLTHLKEAAIP